MTSTHPGGEIPPLLTFSELKVFFFSFENWESEIVKPFKTHFWFVILGYTYKIELSSVNLA